MNSTFYQTYRHNKKNHRTKAGNPVCILLIEKLQPVSHHSHHEPKPHPSPSPNPTPPIGNKDHGVCKGVSSKCLKQNMFECSGLKKSEGCFWQECVCPMNLPCLNMNPGNKSCTAVSMG